MAHLLWGLPPPAMRLRTVMSGISERLFCAGWLDGVEFDRWRAVVTPPGEPFEEDFLSWEIDWLRDLAREAGG